jgi:hypothetical protein
LTFTFQFLLLHIRSLSVKILTLINVVVTGPGPFPTALVIIDIDTVIYLVVLVDTVISLLVDVDVVISTQAATGKVVPVSSIVVGVLVGVLVRGTSLFVLFVTLNPYICLISQISTLACIGTFVLEICLEKFFNGPTMWEPPEIAMTLACLMYKILRKKKIF